MERQLTLTTNSKKLLLKSAGLSSNDYVNDVIALYGSRFGKKTKTIEKNLFAYLLKEENKKRQNRNDAIEVKALIKKYEKPKVKKIIKPKNVIIDITHTPLNEFDERGIFTNNLIKKLEELKNKTIGYLQLTYDKDEIMVSTMFKITKKTIASIYWDDIFPFIRANGSDDFLLASNEDRKFNTFRLIITTNNELPSKKIIQSYRDGSSHCVIEPLFTLWSKMGENSESQASKKRCFQIANKIKGLNEIYKLGVPEDKMEEVAKIANRCIIIHDIIGNVLIKYNEKSNKYFHFTNTRKNHVDLGFITVDKQYENVKVDELHNIIDNAEWALLGGDFKNPQSVRTSQGAFSVFNEKYELFKDFNKLLGIDNYSINAVKFPELNAFIKESRLISSAPIALCNNPNDLDTNHADLTSAYTQHSQSEYYQGFLGKIHHWSQGNFSLSFIKRNIGIYKFKVIKNDNELLSKLGIHKNKYYTLPSPEIIMMTDNNVKVEIIAGCWGSTFNIEYTEEMLSDRNYCIWAGKLGSENTHNIYSFKGDEEWASHLKAELGNENVFYFNNESMIVIKILKKSYTTKHHILSFITSYTRINMFNMMNSVEGKVTKIILDGLYYKGTLTTDLPYKNKEIKKHQGFGESWYFESEVNTNNWAVFDKRFDGNCVLAGAGGTGKSSAVFEYGGFTNILYVVPSHMLGSNKNYTTIHRLIGIDCQSYRDMYQCPDIIFCDELTMMDKTWIEKMILMYPECLILIGGDIDGKQWFQTRNGYQGHFSEMWLGQGWRFVYFNNDYRSLDDGLKKLKVDVRNEMKRIFTGEDYDVALMKKYIMNRVETIKFEDAILQTKKDDIWIVGTHKTEKRLKDSGVSCEFNGIIQPSFTIHSFQGLTIEKRKVFIKLDMFEYSMLYTAISRVRELSQLVFVY